MYTTLVWYVVTAKRFRYFWTFCRRNCLYQKLGFPIWWSFVTAALIFRMESPRQGSDLRHLAIFSKRGSNHCGMMHDGRMKAFDGMSLFQWSTDHKIIFCKEFGCNCDTHNPYAFGTVPRFKQEQPKWVSLPRKNIPYDFPCLFLS